jgi:sulfate transport system permease protein
MSGAVSSLGRRTRKATDATTEPLWVQMTLIGVALIFLALFLVVPLIAVFTEAFSRGADVY